MEKSWKYKGRSDNNANWQQNLHNAGRILFRRVIGIERKCLVSKQEKISGPEAYKAFSRAFSISPAVA